MSEGNSRGLFGGIFKRGSSKASPKDDDNKSNTASESTPRNEDDSIASSSPSGSKKEDRRVQVRRAQIEHRKRKKNLVQYLEAEVIAWRQKVATVTDEGQIIQSENESLKALLTTYNLPAASTIRNQSRRQAIPPSSHPQINALRPQRNPASQQQPQQSKSPSPTTTISLNFNVTLNLTHLEVQQQVPITFNPDTEMSSPEIFNFPTHDFGQRPNLDSFVGSSSQPTKPQNSQPSFLSTEDWQAQIAINFILALEHPCRTHFSLSPSAPSTTTTTSLTNPNPNPNPNPNTVHQPTGHELMASTSLYACAPSYVFPHASTGTGVAWDLPTTSSPAAELHKLRDLNDRLEKDELELTPVQAWFALLERYGGEILLGESVGGGVDLNLSTGGLRGRGANIGTARNFSTNNAYTQPHNNTQAHSHTSRQTNKNPNANLLEALKIELCRLVECFAFGAVMNKLAFWDVAESIISSNSATVFGSSDFAGGGPINAEMGGSI